MEGRVVLVTGAARGIGKEVARQLAGLGATVLVSARDVDHAQAAAEELTPRRSGATAEGAERGRAPAGGRPAR